MVRAEKCSACENPMDSESVIWRFLFSSLSFPISYSHFGLLANSLFATLLHNCMQFPISYSFLNEYFGTIIVQIQDYFFRMLLVLINTNFHLQFYHLLIYGITRFFCTALSPVFGQPKQSSWLKTRTSHSSYSFSKPFGNRKRSTPCGTKECQPCLTITGLSELCEIFLSKRIFCWTVSSVTQLVPSVLEIQSCLVIPNKKF